MSQRVTQPKPRRWRRIARRVVLIVCGVGMIALVVGGFVAWRVWRALNRSDLHPESPTGLRVVEQATAERFMVVAAHPEAARAGADVLRAGGSAVDAAVAVQMTLTLVEPQSSGIGGGGFLLYYSASEQKLRAYDGRETAPASVEPDHFIEPDGDVLSFPEALIGGHAVGVPGVVRLLALSHRAHGKLEWNELFERAIRLCESGFPVSPRLGKLLALDPVLPTLPATDGYFYDGGDPVAVGTRLENPALAKVLKRIRESPDDFYRGAIARDIVRAVETAKRPTLLRGVANVALTAFGLSAGGSADEPAGGPLTLEDLERYRALEREPLCRDYRRYRICGFPPPSSGAVAVLQILGLLERHDLSKLSPDSPDAIHLIAEAQKRAYADRQKWIADPDFVTVPTEGLLSPGYLRQRGDGIRKGVASPDVGAGSPPGAPAGAVNAPAAELPSTSHFSIVDAEGNVVSMTTSIEFGFGSHTMVRGFLLNNQLTDFSFAPERDGQMVANAPEGGKRPMSSMSPTIVFDRETGRPVLALGSPGGVRIIAYVTRALIGVLDWKLSPNAAAALPHIVSRNETTELEDVGWASEARRDEVADALRAMGHDVSVGSQNSGLHLIQIGPKGLIAGIDPRREGTAAGD